MSIKEKWNDFKALVASFVVWAETELKGKTGPEKLVAVVNMIYDKFPWPFPLRFFQRSILKLAVGWLSVRIVEALNIVTDHDFADIAVDPARVVEVSGMPRTVLAKAQNIDGSDKQATIESRFKALCAKYGIDADEMMEETEKPARTEASTGEDSQAPTTHKPAGPQTYFQRSEFTCKDGCGTNKVQQDLIDMLNVIRAAFSRPVTVTSGTRCVANNAKAGGATNSNHLTGHAADIRCMDRSMTPKQMYDVVMRLYNEGKIPQLAGISKNYDSIIHVDVHPKKADGTLRTW